VGAEGISPAVINANQDTVLVVIECIIQHGIKIGKGSADVSRQDYPHSIAAAARGVMILDQLEPVIGYQFVRSAHTPIIARIAYKANDSISLLIRIIDSLLYNLRNNYTFLPLVGSGSLPGPNEE